MKYLRVLFIIFTVIGWSILSASLLKAEEVVLSVDEAIALALRDNPDVLLKADDVNKAKARLALAKSDLWPKFTFTGGWTYTSGYYTKDISQSSAQFSVDQTLYSGGKIINTIRVNVQDVEVSRAILDQTRLDVVFNTANTFYTLLLADELVKLNQNIVVNTRKHLDSLKERYASGEVSQSDILGVESSLEKSQEALDLSVSQAKSAQIALGELLFLKSDVAVKAQGEFNYQPKEIAYDQALLKALKLRPEIRKLAAQEKSRQAAVEVARSGSRPTISASWDYYARSHSVSTTVNTRNWNDYNVAGLTVSWPVFDGFASRHKVEEALIELKQARLLKEKGPRDIAAELKNAYLALSDALSRVTSSEADLLLYKDNYATAQARYKQGMLSVLGQDDAELKYQVSLFNRIQSVYDYIGAKYSFERATGG